MLRYGVPRILLVLLVGAAVTVATQLLLGRDEVDLLALVATATGTLGVLVLDLARSGRRVLADFRQGRFEDALRGTRWLLAVSFRPRTRATLELNLAACHLAAGRYEEGGRVLTALDRDALPEPLQPIWDNNQAYYLLCVGADAEAALALCDRAAVKGPQNPAFRSTRGIAQLELGHVEDAIAELQAAVDAGPKVQGPSAMAENYFHLARAWEARGEPAYARDHYLKSVNVCPDCRFGRKSADRLQRGPDRWPGGE